MNFTLLLSTTLFCLAVSTAVAQSPAGAAGGVIEVERIVDLKRIDDSKEYAAAVDLGNLPVGKQIVIQLTLRNPYDEDIHFSGTEKRCACSQFRSEKKLIPKRDELKCTLKIKTPTAQKSLAVATPVVLVQNEIPVVRMEFTYQLDGLLAFGELMSVVRFENGEQSKNLKIPILASPPIDVRKVQVNQSENLGDLKFEIVAGDSGGMLQTTVTDAILDKGEVRGELTVVYPDTGQDDRYYLIIKDARTSEISPQVVHFRRQGKGLSASATVRIVGDRNTGKPDAANSESEPVSCWHLGEKLSMKLEKLANGLYRVELLVDEQGIARLIGKQVDGATDPKVLTEGLTWKINNGELKTEMTTSFIVDQAENTPNG